MEIKSERNHQLTRIALIGILVESSEAVETINALLHEFREFIVGRMGLPYREKKLSIISVVLDATPDTISALCGKLGSIPGIQVKTICSQPSGGNKPKSGEIQS